MSKKFIHYKVLEFFVRELQLEYEAGQYPRKNKKKRQPNFHTETGFSLNLNLNMISQ